MNTLFSIIGLIIVGFFGIQLFLIGIKYLSICLSFILRYGIMILLAYCAFLGMEYLHIPKEISFLFILIYFIFGYRIFSFSIIDLIEWILDFLSAIWTNIVVSYENFMEARKENHDLDLELKEISIRNNRIFYEILDNEEFKLSGLSLEEWIRLHPPSDDKNHSEKTPFQKKYEEMVQGRIENLESTQDDK